VTNTPAALPSRLSQAAIPEEILRILRRLKDAGHAAYLVGGSIRDLLLGKPAKDYDVATSAHAEQVIRLFKRVIPTGIKHGTVTVLMGPFSVEVTTFRGEGAYIDGRRPESVVFLDNVVDDLARRDFTINAIAFDPIERKLVDPFGGEGDLDARTLRCVGDPKERFSEDGLRPLRAVRFASVLDLQIDPPTQAAIPETLGTFDRVAQERVREELSKLLTGPHPDRGVSLLEQTGLLKRILPEIAPEWLSFTLRRLAAIATELPLRLAALLFEASSAVAESALQRLRYPRKVIDAVAQLVELKDLPFSRFPDDASVRRMLACAGRDGIDALMALAAAQAQALGDQELIRSVANLRTRCAQILSHAPPLSVGDLALSGDQIARVLRCPPGPRIGEAIRYLLASVIEDPSLNRADRLEERLKSWRPTAG
jgi:tRNA nucleotidyltransferase (CCA-adding enzyme)